MQELEANETPLPKPQKTSPLNPNRIGTIIDARAAGLPGFKRFKRLSRIARLSAKVEQQAKLIAVTVNHTARHHQLLSEFANENNWVEKVVGESDPPLTERIWNGDAEIFAKAHVVLGAFEALAMGGANKP